MGNGTETDALVEQKAISPFEMMRSSFQIFLLLWAWLTCWVDMVSNALEVSHGSQDIEHRMPLVVIAVGILMTNVLGVLHFQRKGQWVDACIAAVDFDTPYLACKHGMQILRGQICPDWEALRQRNSSWRSIPLAMVGFVLAFRVLMQIPGCEMGATLSGVMIAGFPEVIPQSKSADDLPYSRWAHDLVRDEVNVSEITLFTDGIPRVQEILQKRSLAEREKHVALLMKLLQTENVVWTCASCSLSHWKKQRIPRCQDRAQNWLGAKVDLERDGPLGGIGSGNLLATNFVLTQKFQAEISKPDMEEAMKPAVLKFINLVPNTVTRVGAKFSSAVLSWPQLVEKAFEMVPLNSCEIYHNAVAQVRPWKVNLGVFEYQVEDGWKIQLFQSFALLVTAILPIRRRVLDACHIHTPIPVVLATLYTVLDTTCLVSVWLLCAMAKTAYFTGGLAEKIFAQVRLFVGPLLKGMGAASESEFRSSFTQAFVGYVLKHGEYFLETLKQNVTPTFAWDQTFFLRLVAGTCLFLAMSAGLGRALCPQRLTTCISVGVCGPLWLFTEEGEEEETFEATARGICAVMISRSVLLASALAFSWSFVNSFSVQFFFALLCNRVWNVVTLKLCCLGVLCAHCALGVLAALVAHDSRKKGQEKSQPTQPIEIATYFNRNFAYGTWEGYSQP